MMNAREDIFSRLSFSRAAEIKKSELHTFSKQSPPRLAVEPKSVLKFIQQVENSGATVEIVDDYSDLPDFVYTYFDSKKLPQRLSLSDKTLYKLDWGNRFELSFGRFEPNMDVSLIEAYAGIIETGTLVSLSSQTLSTASLFLPRYCLVVLDCCRLVDDLEQVWLGLKQDYSVLPRTVNLITGPSRTGDIEQTIQIGAHGPCELHVFLVNYSSFSEIDELKHAEEKSTHE